MDGLDKVITGTRHTESPRIAYLMSRFPKITETFILYEMVAVTECGARISVYPLLREKTEIMHSEAVPFVERANFAPIISPEILASNWHFLSRVPQVYFKTMFDLVRFNWGSFRYLSAAIIFFPKVVHFARKMQKEGIQFIHAHFASHPAMAAYVINRLTGIPYSFTAHGSDLHRDQHMLCAKVAGSAFSVTISEYNRRLIFSHCGETARNKVIVINCGVDIGKFDCQESQVEDERRDAPLIVLCVGTLHEVKGQKYLLEACCGLKAEGVNFSCHFVGDGEDKEMLTSLTEEFSLQEHVVFHGRLTQAEVLQVMQSADVMVQPSVPTANGRREGIPVVLMEGMACGLPVVSSRLSGIPELVDDGVSGILTEPGNIEQIAAAIKYFHDQPEARRKYGSAGRQRVQSDFNLYTNAQVLLGKIREAIGE